MMKKILLAQVCTLVSLAPSVKVWDFERANRKAHMINKKFLKALIG
jgi:hypothetical protein